MLRNPELCGDINHVIDAFTAYGSQYLRLITDEIEQHGRPIDKIRITKDDTLLAYSVTDLIAEKYRALLQQVDRNRFRRQDIFDLFLILTTIPDIDMVEKRQILDSAARLRQLV